MKRTAILAGLFLASQALAHDFPPLRAELTGYQEVPSVSSFRPTSRRRTSTSRSAA